VNDERTDPSRLSPHGDPARWSHVVASIRAAAEPELARREELLRPSTILWGWSRPTALIAASVAVAALGIILTRGSFTAPHAQPVAAAPTGVAEAMGLYEPFVTWVEAGRRPSVEELLSAIPER
jgi:hypothetical protein